MIDNKRIEELIKMMVENDLTEIDISGDGESVTLRRRSDTIEVPVAMHAPAPAAAPLPAAPADAGAPAPGIDDGLVAIKSPMVGTFYTSPDPESAPFVNVGSEINAESVVCLVEAMKVFNEIKAEVSGVIEKILVENGQPVEFDQDLYLVRPR
jgi:acetyl-CoA carboxylase biotin carboxyl carrier protein